LSCIPAILSPDGYGDAGAPRLRGAAPTLIQKKRRHSMVRNGVRSALFLRETVRDQQFVTGFPGFVKTFLLRRVPPHPYM
jgi:hypothetical protein